MTFDKILVALDGSKDSQVAAQYGYWLASELDAKLLGLHVVDPRLIELFLDREFAQELGFSVAVDTSEKFLRALQKIGKTVLGLFIHEAADHGLEVETLLTEGYVVEEILRQQNEYELLILGHKGLNHKQMPVNTILGSVAERVTLNASMPVLIAVQPPNDIEYITVAYDGSESARGALLMAENLAKNTGRQLRAITVVANPADKNQSKLLIEQGESYLREYWPSNIFTLKEGMPAQAIIDYVSTKNNLLVLGAYGYKELDRNVLGSTTTSIIRQSKTSVLVYKPNFVKSHTADLTMQNKIMSR